MLPILKEYRCKHCNKLFFKGDLKHCTIEVKCKNCKEFNVIKADDCKLFLFLNDRENLKDNNNEKIKKVLNECSSCEKNKDCLYYKMVAETNICPLCKETMK